MAEIDDTPDHPELRLSAPVPLTGQHDLSAFDCGEPVLNDWLRHRALKNESRFSRTYVVCAGNLVIGYFCISAGSINRGAAPGKVRRNAPGLIPVSIIGRLAVISMRPIERPSSRSGTFRASSESYRWTATLDTGPWPTGTP